ncbi:futalosine hydrolase [Fundidesulfovibrio terrae]|uniref:futalosine hydrolase n=1 Tax=Fundidesulfovibrio terrae TaxID=2922866 RepID=UPI001FAF9487|nr:futalosine hydrolase [Fundidesulfovibrio terrae]
MDDTARRGPQAPLALVTATQGEMRAALAGLSSPEPEIPARGAAMARLAGRETLLIVTGVGPVNAALELGAALGRHEISGVLNLGVAGSFDLDAAPLEAAVAADAEVYADYGVVGPDGLADASGFAFPQLRAGGQSVVQRIGLDPLAAAQAMGLTLPAGLVSGTAITVAGITGCPERATALAGRHGALSESMEGFSLALGCASRGVPFLEVRTISNRVGERDRAKWKLEQALAGLGALLAGLIAGPGPR